MVYWLILAGIFVLAFVVGIVGWAQIIGSIRLFTPNRVFTIVLWVIILVGVWFLCRRFAPGYMIPFYVGYAVAFLKIVFTKNIE